MTRVQATYDRNGDDEVCLKIMWGDSLNPKSHWCGVSQFLVRDNTANAAKG